MEDLPSLNWSLDFCLPVDLFHGHLVVNGLPYIVIYCALFWFSKRLLPLSGNYSGLYNQLFTFNHHIFVTYKTLALTNYGV